MDYPNLTINPALSLLAILNLLGAAQGLLLSLALLGARGDKTGNRLLAALTLTISIVVSGAVLLTSDYVFVFPHLSRLHQPFVFIRFFYFFFLLVVVAFFFLSLSCGLLPLFLCCGCGLPPPPQQR